MAGAGRAVDRCRQGSRIVHDGDHPQSDAPVKILSENEPRQQGGQHPFRVEQERRARRRHPGQTEHQPKLALGPVLYYWPKEKLLDFYERISAAPVDTVYLGETVCSKRRAFNTDEWLALAERLTAAGKEVVLSTMALLEAESELKTLRRLCENGRFTVEANDMGAVRPVSYTHLDVYKRQSLKGDRGPSRR